MRIFVHMPKCAGISVMHAIEKYRGLNDTQWQINADFLNSVQDRDELLSLYKREPTLVVGNPIIMGHIFPVRYVNPSNIDENFRLVTILREPLQRLISHYAFFKASTFNGNYLWEQFKLQGGSFEEFAFSPEMRNVYSTYTSGIDLDLFTYIGTYEDLGVSTKTCLDLLGILYPDNFILPLENKNNLKVKVDVSSTLEKDLRDFHSEDYAIYDFALNKFHRNHTEVNHEF